ncbi:MAG: hypothetical protein AAF152_06885 [Cyanobacteria bacterium P01_A01_bin.114]
MNIGLELQTYNILAITAITLLVVVTGGVVYLTSVEWRDRRRQSDETLKKRPKKRRQS